MFFCIFLSRLSFFFFFFNDTATTEIYTLSLHDALPISGTKCFGIFSRDTGHSRVPAPPHRMTGGRRLSVIDTPSGPAGRTHLLAQPLPPPACWREGARKRLASRGKRVLLATEVAHVQPSGNGAPLTAARERGAVTILR